MRVALFHNLPSGGAKRSLHEAVSRLSKRHTFDAFTLTCADHGFADVRPFVRSHRVFDFSPTPLLRSPFGRVNNVVRVFDLMRLRRLARTVAGEIDRGGYDVALIEPCQFENSPSVIPFLRRTRSVFYCHEPLRILYEKTPARPYLEEHAFRRRWLDCVDPGPGLHRGVLRRVDAGNIRSATKVLVNSEFTMRAVQRVYGVTAEVSYHGVDCQRFRPLAVVKDRALLSVGSLTPLKGFDFLIRSLALIPSESRPPLTIVSNFQNPPERSFIQDLAAECRVEVRLLCGVSEATLVDLYNRALAVVYSPIGEPFGLVTLEAMACGVAVVAVSEGGIRESVVSGRSGLLVDRDERAFADAVTALLENPARAAELGREGRALVESRWAWEIATENLEAHLTVPGAVR